MTFSSNSSDVGTSTTLRDDPSWQPSMLPIEEPYLGPQPYEEKHAGLFFGRRRESRELVSLVLAHPVVLLYSSSGAGKSSLINAGTVPMLREEEPCEILQARVKGPDPEIKLDPKQHNIFVFQVLRTLAGDRIPADTLANMSLAEYLRRTAVAEEDEADPPLRLLILDQFEELFTAYPDWWEKRRDFFDQLRAALSQDPFLHVLLAMREEYLAGLERHLECLPNKGRARLRLERLREPAALAAVEGPLKDSERKYAPGVAEKLVRDLACMRVERLKGTEGTAEVPGEFVEPVQLQVVCQTLWRSLKPDETEITLEHLKQHGDVTQALRQFYDRCLEQVVAEFRHTKSRVRGTRLREWFQTHLITPSGTRGMVFEGQKDVEGMPIPVVRRLESMHLIKPEVRGQSNWYELPHDRLIAPIQKSNQEQLQFAFEKLRRMLIQYGVPVLAVVILVLLVVASIGWRRAEALRQQAEQDAGQFASRLGLNSLQGKRSDTAEAALFFAESWERLKNAKVSDEPSLGLNQQRIAAAVNATPRLLQLVLATDIDRTTKGPPVVFSPNGDLLSVRKPSATLIYETRDPKKPLSLSHANAAGPIKASVAAFSRDGTHLAVASDKTVYTWRIEQDEKGATKLRPRDALCHADPVEHLIFAPDWRIEQDEKGATKLKPCDALRHADPVEHLIFAPDTGLSAKLVTACNPPRICVWDLTTEPTTEPRKPEIEIVSVPPIRFVAISAPSDASDQAPKPRRWLAAITDRVASGKDRTAQSGVGWQLALPFANAATACPLLCELRMPDREEPEIAKAEASNRSLMLWQMSPGEPAKPAEWHGQFDSASFHPNDIDLLLTLSRPAGQELGTIELRDLWRPKPAAESGRGLPTESRDRFRSESGEENLLPRGLGKVRNASFGEDGTLIVSIPEPARVMLGRVNWPELERLRQTRAGVPPLRTAAWPPRVVEWRDVPHDSDVLDAAISPDGKLLATGSRDRKLRTWDVSSWNALAVQSLAHSGAVNSVAFDRTGLQIFSVEGNDQKLARVWDLRTRSDFQASATTLGSLGDNPPAHFDGERLITVEDHPVTRQLRLRVKYLRGGKPDVLIPLTGVQFVRCLVYLSMLDKDFVLAGTQPIGQDKTASPRSELQLWPLAAARTTPLATAALDGVVRLAAFSRDGKRLVTLSQQAGQSDAPQLQPAHPSDSLKKRETGYVQVWNVDLGEEPAALRPALKFRVCDPLQLNAAIKDRDQQAHAEPVLAMAISPDGRTLATASVDDSARLWDLADGGWRATLKGHASNVNAVTFTPKEQVLTAGADGKVMVWNADDGDVREPEQAGFPRDASLADGASLADVSIKSDGTMLLTVGSDRCIRVWDVKSRDLIAIVNSPSEVLQVRFLGAEVVGMCRISTRPTSWKERPDDPAASVLGSRHRLHVLTWDWGGADHPDPALARILAAREIGASTELVEIAPPKLAEMWNAYREQAGEGAIKGLPSADQRRRWHEQQAELCEAASASFGAEWHLTRLIKDTGANAPRDLWARRADARSSLRRYADAIVDLSRAIARPMVAEAPDARNDESLRLSRARLCLDAAETLRQRSQEAMQKKYLDLSREDYQKLLASRGEDVKFRINEAEFLAGRNASELAILLLPSEIKLGPGAADDLDSLRARHQSVLVKLEAWKELAASLDAELKDAQGDEEVSFLLYQQAIVYLAAKDRESYRRVCRELLKRFQGTDDAQIMNRVAWTCALDETLPGEEFLPVCLKLAKSAASIQQGHAAFNTLGAVLYRGKQLDEAIRVFKDAENKADSELQHAQDWVMMAMVYADKEDSANASSVLDRFERWFRANIDPAPSESLRSTRSVPAASLSWAEWVKLRLLAAEARRKVASARPATASLLRPPAAIKE